MPVQDACRGEGQHSKNDSGPACPTQEFGKGRSQGGHIADRKTARQPMRQHKASHQRGRRQAADGIQPQLRQARETRRQQRRETADGRQHAQADRRPQRTAPARVTGDARLLRLDEQVDRIIDRLADQGDPEAQGDAVDLTKTERHGGNTGQRSGNHRDQAQDQCGHGPVDRQQQDDDQAGAQQRQAQHLMLDGRARGHRKHTRAAHLEFEALTLGGREGRRCGVVSPPDGLDRHALGFRIGACGARLRDKQGALAVLRCPYTVDSSRCLTSGDIVDDLHHLPGGIPG